MAKVNSCGYIEHRFKGGREGRDKLTLWRDWWFVKYKQANANTGYINIKGISLPAKYVGKRIRFKIEVLEDNIK